MKSLKPLLAIALSAMALITGSAHGQSFPDKPVKVILPFPAGTGPDTVMRLVGERLSKWWGQPVLIENKPGGNTFIAMTAAKKAAPDGYTLVQVDAAVMTLLPHLYKRLPFDPFKDFVPVAPMFSTHYFVTVQSDSPWKSIHDLVAAAKAKKGQLGFGSSGVGSPMHIGGVMFEAASGAPMTHIPYKDITQLYVDISRGDLTWAFGTASTTAALYQAQKVRYLAVAAPHRHPKFPDVPTVAESGGLHDFELRTWVSLFAPVGTPQSIVDRINTDVSRALREPEITERLTSVGFQPWPAPPQELAEAMRVDLQKYGDVVKKVKINLD